MSQITHNSLRKFAQPELVCGDNWALATGYRQPLAIRTYATRT